MKDLTFGEQVKIILSRKGMTIKELAETIEARTGKAMSRQNLTQRLGRDNFQEQDMRMIAAILGCPFRLSIFPEDAVSVQDTAAVSEDAISKYMQHSKTQPKKKKEESAEDVYQQVLVFDEDPEEDVVELDAEDSEDFQDSGAKQPEVMEDERDMTIGELYEIHEELNELEENVKAGEPLEELIEETGKETDKKEEEEEHAKEIAQAPASEKEPVVDDREIEETKPVKKDRFRTGGIFLRRKGVPVEQPKKEAEPVKQTRRSITSDSEDFEPVIKHNDIEENLELGEVNPYTGREYQTNSVRMHPSRIGYVQVYDRAQHGWTDMTEWAFLGYQERKKVLLGKDYEPPIYLD